MADARRADPAARPPRPEVSALLLAIALLLAFGTGRDLSVGVVGGEADPEVAAALAHLRSFGINASPATLGNGTWDALVVPRTEGLDEGEVRAAVRGRADVLLFVDGDRPWLGSLCGARALGRPRSGEASLRFSPDAFPHAWLLDGPADLALLPVAAAGQGSDLVEAALDSGPSPLVRSTPQGSGSVVCAFFAPTSFSFSGPDGLALRGALDSAFLDRVGRSVYPRAPLVASVVVDDPPNRMTPEALAGIRAMMHAGVPVTIAAPTLYASWALDPTVGERCHLAAPALLLAGMAIGLALVRRLRGRASALALAALSLALALAVLLDSGLRASALDAYRVHRFSSQYDYPAFAALVRDGLASGGLAIIAHGHRHDSPQGGPEFFPTPGRPPFRSSELATKARAVQEGSFTVVERPHMPYSGQRAVADEMARVSRSLGIPSLGEHAVLPYNALDEATVRALRDAGYRSATGVDGFVPADPAGPQPVTAAPFGSLPRVDSIALVARGQTPRDAALLAQPLVLYGHPEDVGRLAAEAASLRERAAASGDAVLLLTYPAAVESFVAALASRVSLEPVTLATTVEGRLPEVWRLPAARLVATGPGGRELVLEGPNPVLLPGNGPFEVRRLPG